MKTEKSVLILTNGDYGSERDWYRRAAKGFDAVFCADGGAAAAVRMGIRPDVLLGDMDSIAEIDRQALAEQNVTCRRYPAEKDLTDTQLALETAVAEGATRICLMGGTGSRLDHTLANLYSAGRLAEAGLEVWFADPGSAIQFVIGGQELKLQGNRGDTVSVLSLSDQSIGVHLKDFYYPLEDYTMTGLWPIGVSNLINGPQPTIRLQKGLLAVFHYRSPV